MVIGINEAIKIVEELLIADNKEDLVYKAAVILVYGIANKTVNITKIKQVTGYTYREVISIMSNFERGEKIIRRKWNVPIAEDELHNIIEITLSALVGAGDLVCEKMEDRQAEKKWPNL